MPVGATWCKSLFLQPGFTMSTPAPTPSDKVQKASAAAALLIILGIIVLVIFGSIKAFFDGRAKDAEMAKVMNDLEQIDASQESAALKSKKYLEVAFSTWDIARAVDAEHSPNYTLNRVSQHVQSGYNLTAPLSAPIFDKAAEATCLIRVRRLDSDSPTYLNDIYDGYTSAQSDFEAWRPYLSNYDKSWGSCGNRFRVLHDRYTKRLEKEQQMSMKEIGAKVGQATSEVGKWWDSATKPLSDAVDDFKSGYNSGK